MSEITPREAYNALIYVSALSFYYPPHPELERKCARALDWAREMAQKIAAGELVELSCKRVIPNGIGDCAGSRDEWFREDFCRKCHKYDGARMDSMEK